MRKIRIEATFCQVPDDRNNMSLPVLLHLCRAADPHGTTILYDHSGDNIQPRHPMIYSFIPALCMVMSLFLGLPSKSPTKWSYHLPQGKSYSYHFSYTSEATSGGPHSSMEQSLDADVSVTVTRVEAKGTMTLVLKTSNVHENFKKEGEWSPVHIILLPESEITIDPTGAMVSGKVLRDDTSHDPSVQKLNQEQVLERTIRQILYRFPQRDTFYDGYAWHDTIPKLTTSPNGGSGKPLKPTQGQKQPMQTFVNYSVSAGTEADPKFIWTLNYDMLRTGKPDGKDFSETTKGYYTFEEANGMIAGYEVNTETHRGGDYFKTTKQLKLKF